MSPMPFLAKKNKKEKEKKETSKKVGLKIKWGDVK